MPRSVHISDDEEDSKERGKSRNKKRFHKKSLYSKEDSDDDDDESDVLFIGIETSNDEKINSKNEENEEMDKEVEFEKEFYCALDEIKKLAKKNHPLKERYHTEIKN